MLDRSGGHAPPAARHLFPDSAGRSVRLFRFSSRLGQWGMVPLRVCPLDELQHQVENAERHVPHAVGVQQRRGVLPEHRPEGARGCREAERAAGPEFACDMTSARSAVTRRKAVACMLKAIHARKSRKACGRKAGEVADKLESMRLGAAARTVRDGFTETLAYTEFPSERRRRIRTNNGIERINREIRRRTRVVGTFPDGSSALMLVTARLKYMAEHEWARGGSWICRSWRR